MMYHQSMGESMQARAQVYKIRKIEVLKQLESETDKEKIKQLNTRKKILSALIKELEKGEKR